MPKRPDLSTALRYAATCVYGAEGFRATAFLDTLARHPCWTIGHGTTIIDGSLVRSGMTCTREQADTWAMSDMRTTGEEVLAAVHVDLNAMQLAALISLAYNIGIGNFWHSSVLEALNLALYQLAAERILNYDEAGNHVQPGLVARRHRERALFLTGMGIAHEDPRHIMAPPAAVVVDQQPESQRMSLSDFLAATEQGAASVYHAVLATGVSIIKLDADHPEAAALIEQGASYANALLRRLGIPGLVLSVIEDDIVVALKLLAVQDATVPTARLRAANDDNVADALNAVELAKIAESRV